MATKEQQAALARIMGGIKKNYGKESVQGLTLDVSKPVVHDVIPTGVEVLDHHILGIGGLKRGRMYEWYGAEGAGKTSMGYQIAAQNQRLGGLVLWVDSEQAFDV